LAIAFGYVDRMTTAKTCGPCGMCCKVPTIEELAKPADQWCRNFKAGSGCQIYETRPDTCRGFRCVWLSEPSLPAAFRPDRAKVVLARELTGGVHKLVAYCDGAAPQAWRQEPMYGLLKSQAKAGWASGKQVLAYAGRQMWLITPTQDIPMGEVDERTPYTITRRSDGTATVTVHPRIPEGEDLEAALGSAARGAEP
jgi:hypothetical protein